MTGEKMRNPIGDHDQDRLWVSASQKGDAAAFNRLVLKWEKTVYNVALRMLKNPEEAAEATQEVFLLAFRSIGRFRKDAKFSSWIYKIVINYCITCIKSRPRGVHLPLDDGSDTTNPIGFLQVAGTQNGDLLRSETQMLISTALARLLPEQQAVIELKFFQDLTFEEIAGILDIPLSTIKSRLYAGLEVLKARLGNGYLAGWRELS